MQEFTENQLRDARGRWDVVSAALPLKRHGREFRGLCPFHNEKSPSFYVTPDKGFFHCFGCGSHGTVIDFVIRHQGMQFRDAVRHILGLPMQAPREQVAAVGRSDPRRVDAKVEQDLREIIAACEPIRECTEAALYLYMRGIPLNQPGIRYHPALECFELGRDEHGEIRKLPAIVAPITNSRDEVTAILRTWLVDRVIFDGTQNPKDNRAKLRTRKKGLGIMGDGAIRLAWPDHVFGLAEGWETACSVRRLFNVPVWATCGTARFGFPGHWRERRPADGARPRIWFPPDEPGAGDDAVWLDERAPSIWLPPEARRVMIFGDNGDTGQTVARHAANYWRRHGIPATAEFPKPEFGDFNDQLLAQLGVPA